MSKEDWYRNTDWNDKIESEFESRLKRSRGNYHKAQYLRIQASYLLNSEINNLQEKGIEFMERVIMDYPDEKFSTIHGNEQLGDFYLKNESFEKAEEYFRIVTEHYYAETRSGTTGLADLKLCETILKSKQSDKFLEAYRIATDKFNETGGSLMMNSDKFYFANLMANLCFEIGEKDEASEFAKSALELSKISEPQFNRHKTVGLITAEKEELKRLKNIMEKKSLVTTTAIKNSGLSAKLKNIFKK
jgi:tetratricopeptide (TPR) repeat protein